MQTLIFLILWIAELILAAWSVRIAQFFSYRMGKMAPQPINDWSPSVAVILPIKGIDENAASNINAILNQQYAKFRLIFAVESADDPICQLLHQIAAGQPSGRISIVVAGLATDRGQKVHNQLAAIATTTPADEILAFVDADANPGPQWLQALVGPLGHGPHIGATTGYRFYVPANAHPANAILSVANALIASLLGPYRRTIAWGGSMAIRRPDFFTFGIDVAWQHALSDDFTLSWCVKHKARSRIHFVPQCLVASQADYDFPGLFEFMTRQFRITRISGWYLWASALAGTALYLFTLVSSLILTIVGIALHQTGAIGCAAVFLALYSASILRGLMLLRGGCRSLPDHIAALNRIKWWYTIGFPLVQAWIFITLIKAGFGRHITWRGITYQMTSHLSVRVISN